LPTCARHSDGVAASSPTLGTRQRRGRGGRRGGLSGRRCRGLGAVRRVWPGLWGGRAGARRTARRDRGERPVPFGDQIQEPGRLGRLPRVRRGRRPAARGATGHSARTQARNPARVEAGARARRSSLSSRPPRMASGVSLAGQSSVRTSSKASVPPHACDPASTTPTMSAKPAVQAPIHCFKASRMINSVFAGYAPAGCGHIVESWRRAHM
jgi:hypothetical protein